MSSASEKRVPAPPLWQWLAPAAAVTAVSLVLIWAVHGLPTVCPAIYPAPPSCTADLRLAPAVIGSITLALLFAALVVTGAAVASDRRHRVMQTLLIVIVVAAVVAPVWTLLSSSFVIG
jgi:hypothetical protein